MSNEFSKEEKVIFDKQLAAFQDALVMSRAVSIFRSDDATMERTSNVVWRPQPYIMQSYDGTDASSHFGDVTQLSVPASLSYPKHSSWSMTATELRDAVQEGRIGEGARKKLASDINVALMNVAAYHGSLAIKVTTAATGYKDAALCETIMSEQGVPYGDRYLALASRDYLNMVDDISKASRSFGNTKSEKAYEESYLGPVAGFDTYKLDYAVRLQAAGGGAALTMDTRDAAVNYYVPKATTVATTGERSNVDNRFQTITISSTVGNVAGDAFTVAALNAVHHVTKVDTGQLKTFRVVSVIDGTTMVITPPMITNQVVSDATAQYQNCVINTKAANSAIVFLNTVAAPINCFWHKDALEILPGRYAVPSDSGVAVLRASTDQGIELVLQKWYDIDTMKTKFRYDTLFGVVNKQPEMSGIILFSQT